jgi:hypothetical protein
MEVRVYKVASFFGRVIEVVMTLISFSHFIFILSSQGLCISWLPVWSYHITFPPPSFAQ